MSRFHINTTNKFELNPPQDTAAAETQKTDKSETIIVKPSHDERFYTTGQLILEAARAVIISAQSARIKAV